MADVGARCVRRRPRRGSGGRFAPLVRRNRRSTFVSSGSSTTRARSACRTGGALRGRSLTVVRYPATGGPYPLIVFAHGYALTPAPYARSAARLDRGRLRRRRAGVPARERERTGRSRTSPISSTSRRDISFVIGRLLSLNRRATGVLGGKIDPSRVAVAGHSDGAETALAVAYDRRYRDRRIRAAIVLSGSALPGHGRVPPGRTAAARGAGHRRLDQRSGDDRRPTSGSRGRPKFLLWLLGAAHLPPYTDQQPQLGIVERATIAFLDHYLKGRPLRALDVAAQRPGLTRFTADP